MKTATTPRGNGKVGAPLRRFSGIDKNQKGKPAVTDHWLEARQNFFSAKCARINAGWIAFFFLRQAKSWYQQYRRGYAFSPGPRWTSSPRNWSAEQRALAKLFELRRSLMTISINHRQVRHSAPSRYVEFPASKNASEPKGPSPLATLYQEPAR
jgi:hypothetical protein